MPRKMKEREGTIGVNNFGSKMVVVKYSRNDDIWVQFEKGNLVHTEWKDFCKGNVRNVYDKSVHGVGYLGEGNYKVWDNNKITIQYSCWRSMIERCYSEKIHKKHRSYKDCVVCDEWHNFQNFAKWFDENYYEIEGERVQLDKDIIIKGNKIYSPETCIFVPQRINTLFVKQIRKRGNLPIGVCLDHGKYRATCNTKNKERRYLKSWDTPEEAFNVYKDFKEKYIKEIAEEYKNKIPEKLYNFMITYEVEIND